MSTPKDAYRIGDYLTKSIKIKVECHCGWHGIVDDLLGSDDEDTLWCPQCGTSGWIYS